MTSDTHITKEPAAAKPEPGEDRMRRLVMLFVKPVLDYWKWAVTEGGEVVDSGRCLTITDIVEISRRQWIADVFVDEGFRTYEVRKIALAHRWHCVQSRSHRKRDGIAELLDWACRAADRMHVRADGLASELPESKQSVTIGSSDTPSANCPCEVRAPSGAADCCRDLLPMDERRLKSVASDISRRYGSDTTEMEKMAMQWAIQEFHRGLVSENDQGMPQGER